MQVTTYTSTQHHIWRDALDRLAAAFEQAAAERHLRQDWVDVLDANGRPARELGWVVNEWEAMHAEVNRLRAQAGLGPVSILDVRHKERMAMGHSDYAKKYAIGCADLVVEGDPRFQEG